MRISSLEIFKKIEGFEGYYEISNFGNVKSLERKVNSKGGGLRSVKQRILKSCISGRGYLKVALYKNGITKTRTIHQMVAEAFLNHTPCGHKLVVNHINFDKLNNRVDNLEIVTARENSNLKHLKSTSKYTGVSWKKPNKKWMSRIRLNGKEKYLGLFTDEKQASNAYEKALEKHLEKI